MTLRLISACLGLLFASAAAAGEVTVAVASNFTLTAERLVEDFEEETGHEVSLAHGATGQIYAQIVNGAPFDVFLAADVRRPFLLGDKAAELRSYALGRLALISRQPIDLEAPAEDFAGKRVALADPTVAPYGQAATRAMERLRLDTATFQPVLLSNVGQVAAVFQTGNADIAFVAVSLVDLINPPFVQSLDGYYPEIRQDAALLARAADNPAARAFWAYLFSEDARLIIAGAGYGVPE